MNKKSSQSKRTRRNFSDEYKIEAVKMVTEQGYNVTDAAKQLGINPNQLHQWKNKLSEQEESSDNEELTRLRAENKQLRMERDILKKATAFFANEKN